MDRFIQNKRKGRAKGITLGVVLMGCLPFTAPFTSFASPVKEITHSLLAQEMIRGKVVDQNGNPLEGVTITNVQTRESVLTSKSGDFTMTNAAIGNTLRVTIVGYEAKTLTLQNLNHLTIHMNETIESLDEVVIVGYGTQRKSDLTGSIGTLSGNKVSERNVTETSAALQGAVPGLTVTRSNGAPGSSSSLQIRGVTTIGDSNPLILVDGVPVASIDNVHPSDIETIS